MRSAALERVYLDRPKRYGPRFGSGVTVTEERALAPAQRADEEFGEGSSFLVLHRSRRATFPGSLPGQDTMPRMSATASGKVVKRRKSAEKGGTLS